VEVDVVPRGQALGRLARVAGALQLLAPPRFHAIQLPAILYFGRCHRPQYSS
jgi:hypothetical protein